MKKKIFAIVDCNSFYASCEKIFRPDLKNKPVVVLSNNDGCIVALSKEAKELGIKRGIPLFKAEEIISRNNVAVFSSNYELYGDISQRVMNALKEFADSIEIYSIDEAFLDLSDFNHKDLSKYALQIKKNIFQKTGIPVSIGIGETKTLAKLANHIAKKYLKTNGIFNIMDHEDRTNIFSSLDISSIWGIGFEYTKMLHRNNVNSVLDLVKKDDYWIRKKMTVKGLHTVWELRGKNCIELELEILPKKNILSSRSFGKPVTSKKDLQESIAFHATVSAEELRSQKSVASFVIVFIETNRFKKEQPQYFNSKTEALIPETDYTPSIIQHAHDAFEKIFKNGFEYKRAGVILSGLVPKKERQKGLFELTDDIDKKNKMIEAADSINSAMGRDKIKTGSLNSHGTWKMRRDYRSPSYTTNWDELPIVKAK